MAGIGTAMQDPYMQQFVDRETQRQRFQGIVHEMTGRCWDTCLPGIGSPGQTRHPPEWELRNSWFIFAYNIMIRGRHVAQK